MSTKQRKSLMIGLAFLLPNIAGFFVFTLLPLVSSLVMAFTNWDLRHHNIFNQGTIQFLGFDNFKRLLLHPDFWQYFGNTLFLMLGIPFSIAASLMAALLLSRERPSARPHALPLIGAGLGLGIGCSLLVIAGGHGLALAILVGGALSLLMMGGALGGNTFFRTIYYLPNFTAGVATYLLWKKMYDPNSGPVNAVLQPVLDTVSSRLAMLPPQAAGWMEAGFKAVVLVLFAYGVRGLVRRWKHETSPHPPDQSKLRRSTVVRSILLLSVCSGLWLLANSLPAAFHLTAAGLTAPEWLTSYHWAKPAIMMMGFWAAIGSNNMLLYLAGLSNISPELREAASIDGATATQRFWHVTWPQLSPITFFIVIMSVIGGLQGGFEMARTMTKGGPGGATTTLSYFVYSEGFDTGRLGYASAIAWTLFLFVFIATLFNWKFNQAANE